ncbi:RNA-directed DNA polymerase [Clostridium botulinum]|nr:RNA-directed DNA polymerase [Clostridium botulinum]
MEQCKLELHPRKTRIVYCKDRTQEYPVTKFDFLGYTYKAVYIKCRDGKMRNNLIASVSTKACKSLRDKIKELNLYKMTGSNINIIAEIINPIVIGWINYFSKHNSSTIKYTIECIERRLIKWAMCQYKHLRGRRQLSEKWLSEVRIREPKLFAHWNFR